MELLHRIQQFAAKSEAVTALILVGSQAREENHADAYSDIDLVIVVNDTEPFAHTDDWLREISDFHISFTEPTLTGQTERRVLFAGAQDVDFVIMQKADAARALETGEAAFLFSRGYRVLVNKENIAIPPMPPVPPFAPATEAELCNTVNDFWYHTLWTTKKLLRGELWSAKFCVDNYMKGQLMWSIEQHEHIVRNPDANTWYSGRFVERWAAPDILAALQTCFAHFKAEDIAQALLNTMALFRRLAKEIAEIAGFPYPAGADAYATQWVTARLAPLLPTEPKGA